MKYTKACCHSVIAQLLLEASFLDKRRNHVQSNLDYPDLDYPDYSIIRTFFSGPNFFMNIN